MHTTKLYGLHILFLTSYTEYVVLEQLSGWKTGHSGLQLHDGKAMVWQWHWGVTGRSQTSEVITSWQQLTVHWNWCRHCHRVSWPMFGTSLTQHISDGCITCVCFTRYNMYSLFYLFITEWNRTYHCSPFAVPPFTPTKSVACIQ